MAATTDILCLHCRWTKFFHFSDRTDFNSTTGKIDADIKNVEPEFKDGDWENKIKNILGKWDFRSYSTLGAPAMK